MNIKYTLTNESITVIVDGKSHTIKKGSPNYTGLRKALADERMEEVPNFLTVSKSIASWAKGKFTVENDKVQFQGKDLPESLNRRVREMATRGEDPTPVFKFWEKLQDNPSYRSVNQLWDFLQHENIPLTPEGNFLAYKSVTKDYKDHHTKTVDNSPGKTNKMPRNEISDDPNEACHVGFHVGAIGYARTFRPDAESRMVICLVEPQHVVCVPYDYSHEKMRVCQYEVIGNYGSNLPSTTFEDEKFDEDPLEDELEDDEHDDFPEEAHDDSQEDDAEAEEQQRAREPKKPAAPQKKSKPSRFDKLSMTDLMNLSISDLRRYAGKNLNIVGASKIPGGKTALVGRIMEVRKK